MSNYAHSRDYASIVPDAMRAGVLAGVDALIRRYGGDPATTLTRYGLGDGVEAAAYVRLSNFIALLSECADTFHAPFFGLQLSGLQTPDILGPVEHAIATASTGRQALEQLTAYLSVQVPSTHISLRDRSGGVTEIRHISCLSGTTHKRQTIEHGAGVIVKTLRRLFEDDFRPLYVSVASGQPKTSLQEIEDELGCDIYYDQEVSAVAVPTARLEAPTIPRRPTLNAVASPATTFELPIEEQVDRLIIALLPAGRCDREHCAAALGVAPRTLHARLAARGFEFSQLMAWRRRDLAQGYLRDTNLPMAEIAAALGYADQTTFTRAFSAWVGASPARYRDQGSAC